MEENNNAGNENIPETTVSGNDTGMITPVPDNGTGQPPPEQIPPQTEPVQDNVPEEGHHDNSTGQQEVQAEVQQVFDPEQFSRILKDAFAELESGNTEQTEGLAERLDEMILLLTPEETEEEPAVHSQLSIPSADYTVWDYPVRVTYGITTASGYSTYVSQEMDSSGAFETDFDGMQDDIDAGHLQSFYIRYVYGLDEDGLYNVLLYDSEAPVTVPEEPEENPVADLLLSHLESINTYLADMSAADAEYYQAVLEYREEMLELQRADTASTIILCVAVFMVAAEIIVGDFIGRIK